VVTKSGDVIAGDAKLEVDENAAWRHKDLEQRYGNIVEGDPYEVEAKKRALTYVSLDGEIGIIGNGAGLCLSTLDPWSSERAAVRRTSATSVAERRPRWWRTRLPSS